MTLQNIGGQAVIEGVMLRSAHYCVVAVRRDGQIVTKVDSVKPLRFSSIPVLRGITALYDMLILGISSLLWSTAQAEGDGEELAKKDVFFLLASSVLFAVVFFIALPLFITSALVSSGALFNILDGIFRMGIFIGYVGIISRMEDVRKLFRYHGAEHKVVNCYEQKRKVTAESARTCSTVHPRCGTTFVMVILLCSILVFSLFTVEHWMLKMLVRLLVLPVLAGLSYELIKLAARLRDNRALRLLITPGLWFQQLTTREPGKEELAVAVAALNALLEKEHAAAA
ncbi:DUF1385 domain-containing protein [Candidatus Woesearchaeota archaeon]|nr:DUF1385 domain-containing protein [Candidatus Woesearchaeota archaeon]